MTAATIINALHKVKSTGHGRWMACCPAHEDKNPSLTLRELDDGRVLLHCFGGCGADEVLDAIGMDLSDLFPPRPALPGAGTRPERRRVLSDRQALDLLHDEAQLLGIVAADIGAGKAVGREDCQRALRAAGRIAVIRQEVYA